MLEKRLILVLDRVEELKLKQACDLLPTPLLSALPAVSVGSVAGPVTAPLVVTKARLSNAELSVLRSSSLINGKTFLPW